LGIFFDENGTSSRRKEALVLIIYDITDNSKRVKMAKLLSRFGVRVQKSAFEAWLNQRQYEGLLEKIAKLVDEEVDYVRTYRLTGYSEIKTWGKIGLTAEEDFLIF